MNKNKSHYIVLLSDHGENELELESDAIDNAKGMVECEQQEFTVYKAVYGVTLPKATPIVIKLK